MTWREKRLILAAMRLLLCFALVLANGFGMSPRVQAAISAAPVPAVVEAPCHGMPQDEPAPDKPAKAGCCDDLACAARCLGSQAVMAAPPALTIQVVALALDFSPIGAREISRTDRPPLPPPKSSYI